MLALIALALAAVTMLVRPFGLPYWAAPAVGAVIVASVSGTEVARSAVSPLVEPLLFLVFAVPLAVSLDDLGLFEAITSEITAGRHLDLQLWGLAALVVVVFNLDAAVVLLTPLYIRLARRRGLSPEALAFPPVLLACLASGLLPVSNLTNLIAADQLGLGVTDFVRHMAAPTVVAVGVGFLAYRRVFPPAVPGPAQHDGPADPGDRTGASSHRPSQREERRALRRGLPIVVAVLVGFTLGDVVGVPAWVVAATATVWASCWSRTVRWRSVPLGAITVAGGLAVLVAAALPSLALDTVLGRTGITGRIGALVFGVVGSNATNNLPAVLAAVPSLGDTGQVWPLLVGTDMGPVLVLTGSLSTLLWRDTARQLGVDVTARRYSSVGIRVGGPALLAATAVVLLVG